MAQVLSVWAINRWKKIKNNKTKKSLQHGPPKIEASK